MRTADMHDPETIRRQQALARMGQAAPMMRDGARVPIDILVGEAPAAHKQGEARLAELARRLADSSPDCRISALRSIAQIAPLGHPVSTAKTVMHIQDNNYAVRREALETLSRIAARGDRSVVAALVEALGGDPARNPVQPGDPRDFTSPHRSLSRAAVRPAAHVGLATTELKVAGLRALGAIAGEGDVRAVACLARLAEDRDEAVQDAATRVLVSMGKEELAGDARGRVRARRYAESCIVGNVAAMPQACTEMQRALPLCAGDREGHESRHTKDVGRRQMMPPRFASTSTWWG
ncbi:hypothetical protein T484DRAFT_1930436 [Baffinella frigidus]|nr:hypothetical protein T484DRAFT_1930436 [Cryptophyta sp. CCMP2293]